MWGFLFGVLVGALGYWAYKRLMGDMGMGSMEPPMGPGGSIYRPSTTEVHGRPSEPLPATESSIAEAERTGA
jgi:hypothetical protein